MKIVIFETEPWEQPAFDPLKDEHEVVLLETKLTEENADTYADAEIVSTFIYSALDENVLAKFNHLKMIATRSTGFDHIPLEYCRNRGIIVSNVPEYGDSTVAEHVFGLLLALSHKLVEAVDRTRRGDFSLRGLRGFDLQGKTFGVIGTGSIGQHVIKIAKGFEMNVIAFDVNPDQDLVDKLGFDYVSLDGLLKESDIITLHIPANEHTYHLISDDEFEKMKDGVVSAPFDDEGVPTGRVVLIENGTLNGFVHNTYTAAKENISSTGNSVRPNSFRSGPEVGTTNFYIQPGLSDREKLIGEISRGLYVTDVMGMHTADPISGDFSVGVSGLWIENGEMTRPVKGAAVAGNIVDFLTNVDCVANDIRFFMGTGSPTIRVSDITVSGGLDD